MRARAEAVMRARVCVRAVMRVRVRVRAVMRVRVHVRVDVRVDVRWCWASCKVAMHATYRPARLGERLEAPVERAEVVAGGEGAGWGS